MSSGTNCVVATLSATAILDIGSDEVQELADAIKANAWSDREYVQQAHLRVCRAVAPVYTVNEVQPVSLTLRKKKGSCSQRMACLEAAARAASIPTRVRALFLKGSFWYPRFFFTRMFIPKRILLVWPQFFVGGEWVDFSGIHSATYENADSPPFRNDAESLFDAVADRFIDFFGDGCGGSCAGPENDLSKFVLSDEGLFDTRDEVFKRFGSFQHTLRGRAFELIFGGRKSC
jgi:hypothetical protein